MKSKPDLQVSNSFRPGQLGQLIELHGVLYSREFGLDGSFERFVAAELAQFAGSSNPRERIWLISGEDKVWGSVAVVEEAGNMARLRWYILDPGIRGQGWAKSLLEHALAFAREQGYKAIMLFTLNELRAAKRRYESAGFDLASSEEKVLWGKVVIEEVYQMGL